MRITSAPPDACHATAAIYRDFWPRTVAPHIVAANRERASFHVGLVLSLVPKRDHERPTVVDLGGGFGDVLCALARLGYAGVLVDDFADVGAQDHQDLRNRMAVACGLTRIAADVVSEPLPFAPGSIDAFLTFESMEHWHHSPKALFARVIAQLKPGGLFVIGVPNCVNLRKRLSVPLGYGKWTSMKDWYEPAVFRSHVREPDTDDLRYIARDMGLSDVRVFGRNWIGYRKANPLFRTALRVCDRALRLAPGLCGDIYLIGRKPG